VNDLQRSSPEQQGISSSTILRFVEALEQISEVHSFMLLRHGSVVAEGWWSPYSKENPHMVFSLSKSFTSTAAGFAVNENLLSLDDTVLSFFPEEAPAQVSEHLEKMQVRHLLIMSSGHAVDTWSDMVERSDGNWIKAFLAVPVQHTPDTHFLYNTGATYMLSAIVQKCTGMKLVDYLNQQFFETIGIEDATWEESPQGIAAGGIGLNLKTEDIARFGQFYLQKGVWQGEQLLPEAWINDATSFQISNSDGVQADWTQGYGYQFWCCRHNAYRGDGVFGQFCVVMPEQDAVFVMTGGMDVFDMQEPLNLVWDILLPAMSSASLPDDTISHNNLVNKLDSLNIVPVEGETSSPVVSQVSGKIYGVDENELSIQSMIFNFTESACEITLKSDEVQETILCGYGEWQHSQTTIFNESPLFDKTPVASSGAWTNEDTFTVVFRLIETPFYYTMTCTFADDEVLIEIQVNVSLESTEAIVMMGTYS